MPPIQLGHELQGLVSTWALALREALGAAVGGESTETRGSVLCHWPPCLSPLRPSCISPLSAIYGP